MPRPNKLFDYDAIIIGSGAGGGVAAHIWANENRRVAIVEDQAIGGECPNYGCVPTKALLKVAEIYREAKQGAPYGVRGTNLTFNYPTVRKWKELAVSRTGTEEGDKAFESDGIAVLRGHAHFVNSHEISVSGRRYSARKFLVATGSKDFIPPVEGLRETGFITYRGAIELKSPPKSLFIIGGGPIGVEFAVIFATFGSKVQIAEMMRHIIPREDPEVGYLMGALLEREFKMKIHANTKVTKVEKDGTKKVVHFVRDGQPHMVKVDEILVAAGKRPNTDLGLDNAGVKYDDHGIKTNQSMQTSAKHIFAAGDVVGPFAFTHMAAYQSRVAAHNTFRTRANWVRANYHAVPRVIYTSPEIAAVGMTEEEAKKAKGSYKVGEVPIYVIGRSNVSDKSDGFVKVIADKKSGRILGASIVSPHAGEMIHELALAVRHGLTVAHIESTIHAFPTWSEAVRVACAKIA